MFVIVEDLLTEFVDQLIKDEVNFCLNLIVEELLLKMVQCIVRTVTVEIQRVEDIPRYM